jgi:uncharacterized protein (UPF0335 family)
MAGDDIDMDLGGNAAEQLAGIIERIEIGEADKAKAAAAVAAEKKLAQSNGFDVKAINQILKDRKADTDKTTEARAITQAYVKALAARGGPIGEWASAFAAAQNTVNARRPPKATKGNKFN